MIRLITGLPGHGKSIYVLNIVKEYAEKKENAGRQVFYSGIRNLNTTVLPWINIGGWEKDEVTGTTPEVIPKDAPVQGGAEWFKLPAGSIVIIDECQNYFRTRSQGQKAPVSVTEMETHRHRGFDLFLLTQHPKLIDPSVRRMTELHFHCKRWFGWGGTNVWEYQGVKEEPEKSNKGGILHAFKYPKQSFGWYKSAEIHTVKSRIPARVYFLFVIPFILAGLGYAFYSTMGKYVTSEGAKERIQGKASVGAVGEAGGKDRAYGGKGKTFLTPAEYVESFTPRVKGIPHTASAFDDALKVVNAPTPDACVQSAKQCRCYTSQGTVLDVERDVCKQVVERGFFQYWNPRPQAVVVAQAGPEVKVAAAGPSSPVQAVAAAPVAPLVPLSSDIPDGAVEQAPYRPRVKPPAALP